MIFLKFKTNEAFSTQSPNPPSSCNKHFPTGIFTFSQVKSHFRAAARKTSKGQGKRKKNKDDINLLPREGKKGEGDSFSHKANCNDILAAFLPLYCEQV